MKGSDLPIRKVRSGKKRWLLDCRYVGGRREFYATKEEAEAVRDAKRLEVKNHGTAALSLTNDERLDFVRARDRLGKLGASISQAVDFFEQHHSAVERVRFSDAVERMISIKKGAKKDGEYLRILRANLESLRHGLGGDPWLCEVTREQVEGWLFNEENGWSEATMRNKRIDVRTFFRFAEMRRWLVYNPAAALEKIEKTDRPVGILRPDECEALLRAAQHEYPKFLPYVVLGLFCGLRADEAVLLDRELIQVERGFVEVPAMRGDVKIAKSRQRRLVDLSDNARAWLRVCEDVSPKSENWHSNRLQVVRPKAARFLSKARGVEVANFPWPKNCMRHSFGSYYLALHGDPGKTAGQMGHGGTDMLFRHYRELVTKDDAKRFWEIAP